MRKLIKIIELVELKDLVLEKWLKFEGCGDENLYMRREDGTVICTKLEN